MKAKRNKEYDAVNDPQPPLILVLPLQRRDAPKLRSDRHDRAWRSWAPRGRLFLEKEGAERTGEDSAGERLGQMSALREEEKLRRLDSSMSFCILLPFFLITSSVLCIMMKFT